MNDDDDVDSPSSRARGCITRLVFFIAILSFKDALQLFELFSSTL